MTDQQRPSPRDAAHSVDTNHTPPQRRTAKTLPTLPRHISVAAKIQHFTKRIVCGWWAWELLSAAVALATTVVLVVPLAETDGRAQPTWDIGDTQLTLNTLVAALATVIRAALMLMVAGALNQSPWNLSAARKKGRQQRGERLNDLETFGEAASDSWNSALLLYRSKFRHLASLGALLTILSLAFDTFVQQVLTFETQSVEGAFGSSISSLSAAVLPRVQNYSNVEVPAENQDRPDAQLDMKSALIAGILENSTDQTIPPCPTGHCSWPVTPTIGVCSACANVEEQLHSVQTELNITYSLSWPDSYFRSAGTNSSLTIDYAAGGGGYPVELFTLASSDANSANTPQQGRMTIANFYAFGVSPLTYARAYELLGSDQQLTTEEIDPLMVAYNCTFHFCLQGHNATPQDGNVQRGIVEPWDQTHLLSGHLGGSTRAFDEAPAAPNAPSASAFQVDSNSLTVLGEAFPPVIDGNATFSAAGDTSFSDENSSVTSVFVQALFNASNSTGTMSARAAVIADQLTQHMRRAVGAPPPTDARYAPAVFGPQVVVRVRWVWLAYPLVLVAVGVVFLLLTVLQTRRRHVRPWKAHRVPVLLAGVDESIRRLAVGGLEQRTGLEDRVGGTRVRLEFDGRDGVSFQRVDS